MIHCPRHPAASTNRSQSQRITDDSPDSTSFRIGSNAKADLERERENSAAREAAAREEARAAAEAAAAEKFAEAQAAVADRLAKIEQAEGALQARVTEVEGIRLAAERRGANFQAQLDELRQEHAATIEAVKAEAHAKEEEIRRNAVKTAEEAFAEQLVAKDQAVSDAKAKSAEAESKLAKMSEQFDVALNERLGSQREILERANDEALAAARAKAFDDTPKLQNKVTELQRALENKTAEELGEGAEVNLYEALRKEFPDDRIERVAKGTPGADIRHVVMDHGRECGTIIYDSKNHKAFRTDHVAKLAGDRIAARAEHAILSLHKFPKGTGQLHVQDGVLLANPARVLAVVTLIRRHMVQTHTLRLSNAEREEKTARLYAFITSDRCAQLLDRIEKQADDLLELQNKEMRWHQTNWQKQGEAYRAIQRAKADLDNDIRGIIGAAADDTIERYESDV
jgi:hypothetical protein